MVPKLLKTWSGDRIRTGDVQLGKLAFGNQTRIAELHSRRC